MEVGMPDQTIKLGAAAAALTRRSPRGSATDSSLPQPRVSYHSTNLPHTVVYRIDVELERALVSFRPSTGGVLIRRALTDDERGLLDRRARELEDCLRPVSGADEEDRVALALMEMFGSFSSMRHSEQEALAKIDTVRRFLAAFPAWAIEKACSHIRWHGVVRKDGTRDKQWPPTDSELVSEVEQEVKHRRMMLDQARAMLEAKIDDTDLRRRP